MLRRCCSWLVQLGGGYLSTLALERFRIPQSELVELAWERERWGFLLELLQLGWTDRWRVSHIGTIWITSYISQTLRATVEQVDKINPVGF